jgi:nicotinamidase-related amidase
LDLQADFLGPEARMPVAPAQVPEIQSRVAALVAGFRAAGRPVIYVRNAFPPSQILENWFRNGAAREGTPGARWVGPGAEPDLWVAKKVPDAFSEANLAPFLREKGADGVVIAGVFAEPFNCVPGTADGARRAGWAVTVVSDAVGTASEGAKEGALRDLGAAGSRIRTSAQVLAELSAVP